MSMTTWAEAIADCLTKVAIENRVRPQTKSMKKEKILC